VAEQVKDSRKGGPAHHVFCRSHVETRRWRWFVQLDHPIVLHRPFDGQIELFKGTELEEYPFVVKAQPMIY
jgi:hypothetical protein